MKEEIIWTPDESREYLRDNGFRTKEDILEALTDLIYICEAERWDFDTLLKETKQFIKKEA